MPENRSNMPFSVDNHLALSEGSQIKHVIAVVSGKGGVGKSTVTALLAVELAKQGYKVGILDADLTGASIPYLFGLQGLLRVSDKGLLEPMETKKLGIRVVSIALAMENPEMAVIWRGPLLSKAIQQFWTDVNWGELDLLPCGHAAWNQRCTANGDADAPTSGRSSSNLSTGHGTFSGKESVPHGKSASSACAWFGRKHELRSLPPLRREVFCLWSKPLSEAAQEFNVQVCAEMPLDPQLAELTDKGDIENIGESIGLTLQSMVEALASMP